MIAYIQNPGYEKEYLACQKAMQVCRIPQYAVKYKTPMIRMKRLSVFSKERNAGFSETMDNADECTVGV